MRGKPGLVGMEKSLEDIFIWRKGPSTISKLKATEVAIYGRQVPLKRFAEAQEFS